MVNAACFARMAEIHDAVVSGVVASVHEWYRDPATFPLSVDPRVASVMEWMRHVPYTAEHAGTLRPDLLHDARTGDMLVCEINARFPLNGFVASAVAAQHIHQRSMTPSSLYARRRYGGVGASLGLLEALRSRFLRRQNEDKGVPPVFVIHLAESLHDTAAIEHVLRRDAAAADDDDATLQFIHCGPGDLGVDPATGALTYVNSTTSSPVPIQQAILELTQTELLSLPDVTLKALAELSASGRTLNDLRTILFAHDKRLLMVLRNAQQHLPGLPRSVQATLRGCIVPSVLASQYSPTASLALSPCASAVLKPCLLGKGAGIVMQHECPSDAAFAAAVADAARNELADPHIVQPYIEQHRFTVLDAQQQQCSNWHMVSTLLSLDGKFYGPGVFRAAPGELVALSRGGIALFPVMPLDPVPPTARLFAQTLADVDPLAVRAAIAEHGLALVGIGSSLKRPPCRAQFQALVVGNGDAEKGMGARPRQHNDLAKDYVWEVRVEPSSLSASSASTAAAPLARSQTAEAFDVHTDASFEQPPPRCFVLAVVSGDRKGAGLSSFASVARATAQMDPDDVVVLRRTIVHWRVPPEFQFHDAAGELLLQTPLAAPVLMSECRARVRRDVVSVDHLADEADRARFWSAFDAFELQLKAECERNTFLLPEQSLLFIDNETMVHARSHVLDTDRLLWRIRYDVAQRPELDRLLLRVLNTGSDGNNDKNNSDKWTRLANWPILDKDSLLRQIGDKVDHGGAFYQRGGVYWSPSGGSTGNGKTPAHCSATPSSIEENSAMRTMLRNMYRLYGALPKGTVCVNLFGTGNLQRSLEVQSEILVGAGATNLPMSAAALDADVVACTRYFGANMLMGLGSRLVQLVAYCERNGLRLPTVQTVIHGGEVLSSVQRATIRRVCGGDDGPTACRLLGIYGSAECGVFALGQDDDNNDVEQYRVVPDGVHLEVLSLDSDSHVPDDGSTFGRLVVTNLLRSAVQSIVRYDTGDLVRFVSPAHDTIEVRGRVPAATVMSFGNEHVMWDQIKAVVDPVLARLPQATFLYQLWVSQPKVGALSAVELAIFPSSPGALSADLVEMIQRKLSILFDPKTTLVDKVDVRVLSDATALHRSPRSNKLYFFVDKRLDVEE